MAAAYDSRYNGIRPETMERSDRAQLRGAASDQRGGAPSQCILEFIMPRALSVPIILSFCVFAGINSPAFAQCEIGWSNPFDQDWPSQFLRPTVEFDEDGEGPIPSKTLFTGYLVSAGNVIVEAIAAWDGTYWSAFPSASGLRGKIETFAVMDDDGNGPLAPVLYAGGSFTDFGGISATRLARYDHGMWHGLSDGVAAFNYGTLKKLVVMPMDAGGPLQPRLFALGSTLAEINGINVNLVGENLLGDFIESDILVGDLDGAGPDPSSLVRCGRAADAVSTFEVDQWTGTQWQRLGGVFNGWISRIVMFDPDQSGPRESELYVAGTFTQINGQSIPTLARWRDGQWQPLETPMLGAAYINSLDVGDDDGLGPRGNSLFVAGSFFLSGPPPITSSRFARWDGQSWGKNSQQIQNSPTQAIVNLKGQSVFRWFSTDPSGNYVWDGSSWDRYSPVTSPNALTAFLLHDFDGSGPEPDSLIVAGRQLYAINDGVSETIAAWNGRAWSRVGSRELNGQQFLALDEFDFDGDGPMPPQIVVAGRLIFANQVYAAATLENDVWVPLGNSQLGSGSAVKFARLGNGLGDEALYMGGSFTSLDGDSSLAYLAQWTPAAGWTAVPGPLDRQVTDLLVQDDDGPGPIESALYVAGPWNIGSLYVGGVGRWNGNSWSPLVDITTGAVSTPRPVSVMCSLTEPSGRSTLCVSGYFNTIEGLKYAAQWKEGHWWSMGTSLTAPPVAMTMDNLHIDPSSTDRLYGCTNAGLVRWSGQEWEMLSQSAGSSKMSKLIAADLDGIGPRPPQLFVGGSFFEITTQLAPTEEKIIAPGLAMWGPREPFYFATPWDRSIAAGDRLSLKVATGGPEPMTFAWTRDGVVLTDGGAVSGATTRELVINPVAFGDSGQYECIATNACGSIPSGPTLVRVCATLTNGDLNADGHIDGLDISPFVAQWTSPSSPESDCAVDLTQNGIRDPDDIAWFIGRLLSP